VRGRGPFIEFGLIVILMTVLGALAREVLPDWHQLARFALVVAVTVPVVLGVQRLRARVGSRGRS
jgi:hypothetical protein